MLFVKFMSQHILVFPDSRRQIPRVPTVYAGADKHIVAAVVDISAVRVTCRDFVSHSNF